MDRIRWCWNLLLILAMLAPGIARGEADSPLYAHARNLAEKDGYTVITTRDLARLLASPSAPLLVDVRFDYEYRAGHLPGAVNMPVDLGDRTNPSAERKQEWQKILGRDQARPIVLYCRDFR